MEPPYGECSTTPKKGGMKMRARFMATTAALTTGALLLVLASAHAGSPWKGEGEEGEHKDKHHDEYLQELNLTPEQMEQFTKQREEKRSAMEGLRNSIREKHRELREELDRETTDSEKLASIVSDLKSLEAQRIDQKVKSIVQMKEILTPEQFQKMQSMHKKHWKEGHGKKGKKGHRRCGGKDEAGEPDLPSGQEQEPSTRTGESKAE